MTQAREYAELIWPLDMLIVICFRAPLLQHGHDREEAKGACALCFRVVCVRCRDPDFRDLLLGQRHLAPGHRRAPRDSGCDPPLVLRAQHLRPPSHTARHRCDLLRDSKSMPEPPVQPFPLSAGFLVTHRGLHPHRNPSPASGARFPHGSK